MGAALAALELATQAYPVREVAARSIAFIRSAELVSGRVALVASGNLALALALDQRFPRRFLTRADERRADLLRFMVSAELGQNPRRARRGARLGARAGGKRHASTA